MNQRFRRVVCGISLVGAPGALLIGTAIHPGLRVDGPEQLELIARYPGAWYATHGLGLVFVTLMIPAVFALMYLLRDREPFLAHLGGAASLIGLVGWCSIVVIYGFVFWQMGVAGDRAEMAALLDRLTHTPGVLIPTRIAAFGVVGGMICLAGGLLRAHVVPAWSCAAIATGFVQFAVGAQNGLLWLMTLGTISLTAGLGMTAVIMLRADPCRRGDDVVGA